MTSHGTIYCAGKQENVGRIIKVDCFCRFPGSSKGGRRCPITSSESENDSSKLELHFKLDLDLKLHSNFTRGMYMCSPERCLMCSSVVRVSQGFWGTREHWQNIEGNKGTLANFWEQGNKIRKITIRKNSDI